MTALRVGLTRYDGLVLAWVLDLPGCVAGAATEEALEQPLRLAVAEHRAWVRARSGHEAAPWDGFQFVEAIDASDHTATGGEFCFEADREPLSEDELDELLAHIGWASTDLTRASDLPDEILDWEPPATTLGAADPWSPEPRTAREIHRHALQLEVYYRGGLASGEGPGIFAEVDSPEIETARTAERLLAAWREGAGSFWVSRPGRPALEEWTIRKAARRLISHHRIHGAEITQRWTWVMLGAPVVHR